MNEGKMKPGDNNNAGEKPLRVLVIEDNNDDSDLLVRQLQRNNFEGSVKVIPDGQEAWDLLSGATPHPDLIAIFLDLKLPKLSGLKLLAKIRADSKLCTIPVFVMTSSNDPKDLAECTRLGVEGYIPKPVTFTTFSKAVADLFHSPIIKSYVRVE
jgi:two-component system response regulator